MTRDTVALDTPASFATFSIDNVMTTQELVLLVSKKSGDTALPTMETRTGHLKDTSYISFSCPRSPSRCPHCQLEIPHGTPHPVGMTAQLEALK